MSSDSSEFNKLTDTRFGRMLYNCNDAYIGKSIELYGEFSHGEWVLFDALIQPNMTVVEVGANIGSHTIPIAQKLGQGRLHAFEPQRVIFQTLCANVALNQLTNVITYHAGAGAETGTLKVPELDVRAKNNFGGLGIEGHDFGEVVPIRTIDSLDLPQCHFIKADVEGMEESVLRGAAETIKKHRPLLYVENDRKEKSMSLLKYLFSLDYRLFAHHPPMYNEKNFKENSDNVFENIVSKNILCVPSERPCNINGLPEIKMEEGTE